MFPVFYFSGHFRVSKFVHGKDLGFVLSRNSPCRKTLYMNTMFRCCQYSYVFKEKYSYMNRNRKSLSYVYSISVGSVI